MQPLSMLELYGALSALAGVLIAYGLVTFVRPLKEFCAKPASQIVLFILVAITYLGAGLATTVAFKLLGIALFFGLMTVGIRTERRKDGSR